MGVGCLACGRFFHNECLDIRADVCCCRRGSTTALLANNPFVAGFTAGATSVPVDTSRADSGSSGDDGNSEESAADILNRSLLEFPIDRSIACEWKGLADCGGGKYPIIGCANGYQLNLHHGPVKIIAGFMDNDGAPYDFDREGNIHRICGRCHLLWHYWNEETYDPVEALDRLHSPRPATPHELILWSTGVSRPNAPEPYTGTFRKDSD